MNTLKDFSIGDKVVLKDSILHKAFAGRQGVVSKLIKNRNAVKVLLSDGIYYEAFPENVEKRDRGTGGQADET